MRLTASADTTLWVPVTGSFGLRGRRHRKAAIQMLMTQATGAMGEAHKRGGFAAWAVSQAVPAMMRKAAGRVLVWVWKSDPELLVAMATVQVATPQMRVARASRPIEYDDTESFPHPTMGVGEKLVLDSANQKPPFVSYTWDLGSHLVELTLVSGDATRFGTVMKASDDLARSLRVSDDVTVGESSQTLRIDPV